MDLIKIMDLGHRQVEIHDTEFTVVKMVSPCGVVCDCDVVLVGISSRWNLEHWLHVNLRDRKSVV